ncbi:uncharacterized protein LOC144624545 [Crassostrea virginica]
MFRLYICLGLVALSFEYENLALNKPAYQQHPYSGPIPSHLTEASNAVDGLYQNLSVWGGQCVYSDDGQQTATLWIDLTRIYNIQSIYITYMRGDSPWGPLNKFTSRLLGFSIYVSNTTNKSEGTLCHKERHYNTSTITSIWSVGCQTHGQYVFFYNERMKGVTYPDYYSTYAYNDLCELRVFGCPTLSYYKHNCSLPCPDPNCLYCHMQTGACLGCKPGYQGHHCELECDDGLYGESCQHECGHCTHITQCHHEHGTCLNGCKAGYTGAYCKEECNANMYGANCSLSCGNCRGKGQCHHVNGSCLVGCDPGFQGDKCSQECNANMYGSKKIISVLHICHVATVVEKVNVITSTVFAQKDVTQASKETNARKF